MWDIFISLCDPVGLRKFDEIMRSTTLKKSSITASPGMELERLLQHLLLECSILLHIMTLLRFYERLWEETCQSISNLSYENIFGLSFLPVDVVQLFSSLTCKVLWLPICRMFYLSGTFLSGLTILDEPLILRSIADNTRVSIVLSLELIQQVVLVMPEDEKQEFVNNLCTVSNKSATERRDFSSLQNGLVYDLTKCSIISEDPIISTHMLDLVFLLTEDAAYLHEWRRNVTWKYLQENSASENIVAYDSIFFFPLPRPLVKCVELGLDLNVSMTTPSNRCLINLIRGLKKCFRTNRKYTTLYYSLVAHWSHTVYNSRILDLCLDFHKVINAMKSGFFDGESCKFDTGLRPCKGSRISTKSIKIQALDKYSVPHFFDLTLLLTVATLAIVLRPFCAPQGVTFSDKLSINQKSLTETVGVSVAVVEVFGSLLNLYTSTHEHFPKTSVQGTVNVCQHVLKLCEDFINFCATMVESSGSPRRKRSSVKSPIQTLIDGIRHHCCDAIKLLCNSFMLKNDLRRESMMISLCEKNEKMSDILFAVESSCNLNPSSLMALPSSNGFKRSKIAGIKTSDKLLDERIVLPNNSKSAKDTAGHGSDDDSFEANGDWGVHEAA